MEEQASYILRGFLGGRKQPEEYFTSEVHARKRAAYLGTLYDSVVVGRKTPAHGGPPFPGSSRKSPPPTV